MTPSARLPVLPGGETLRAFASAAGAGVLVVDDAGRVLLSNPAAEDLLDRTADELDGTALGYPLVPSGTSEIEVVLRDGTVRSIEMQVTATRWGAVVAYVVTLADAGQRRRFARTLADSEERFRTLFEPSPVGLAVLDVEGHFVRVNDSLCEMFGYAAHELERRPLVDVVGPEWPAADETPLGDGPSSDGEGSFVTRSGETRWARFVASPVSHGDERPQLVVSVEDVTDRHREHARVTRLALYDGLTGLANRTLAMNRLQLAQGRAARSGSFVGLLFLDLDGFKAVNDSLGHAVGDALLVQVARRLGSVLRPSDTAARLGGDEFVICCDDLGTELKEAQGAAQLIAARIAAVLAEPVELEGTVHRTTASVGIALVKGLEHSPDTVLRNADQAMYRAKQQGGARVELFDAALQARAVRRSATARELARALERGELVVHYQPITDLRDGRIAAAEALVRWEHPERGLLLPGDFLDVAEESRLIISLGEWVLRRVCDDLAGWRRSLRPDFVATVNASARQLGFRSLAASVHEVLAGAGLDPGALKIELTETMLIEATESTLAELCDLRGAGVRVGLDDFGTGYASLTSLRRLPLDFVKVDASFVAGLADRADDTAIVTAIVDLAHALGLDVIAEGVESGAQREALERMGCRYAQGWHLGRPRDRDALAKLLAPGPG